MTNSEHVLVFSVQALQAIVSVDSELQCDAESFSGDPLTNRYSVEVRHACLTALAVGAVAVERSASRIGEAAGLSAPGAFRNHVLDRADEVDDVRQDLIWGCATQVWWEVRERRNESLVGFVKVLGAHVAEGLSGSVEHSKYEGCVRLSREIARCAMRPVVDSYAVFHQAGSVHQALCATAMQLEELFGGSEWDVAAALTRRAVVSGEGTALDAVGLVAKPQDRNDNTASSHMRAYLHAVRIRAGLCAALAEAQANWPPELRGDLSEDDWVSACEQVEKQVTAGALPTVGPLGAQHIETVVSELFVAHYTANHVGGPRAKRYAAAHWAVLTEQCSLAVWAC